MKEMTYQEIIDKMGGFIYYPVGTSMLPLIRESLDSVKLIAIHRPIKKYDVVLYKRDNDKYILHRVVKTHHNCFDMIGDNQLAIEKNITREQIIAILDGIYQQDKFVSIHSFHYKLYVRSRFWVRLWRKFLNRMRRCFRKQKS